jgi:hypothetical protein
MATISSVMWGKAASARTTSGSGGAAASAVSSNSSWEKPNRRLPMAWMAWWVRSTEKPPARNIPIIESM